MSYPKHLTIPPNKGEIIELFSNPEVEHDQEIPEYLRKIADAVECGDEAGPDWTIYKPEKNEQ